MKYYCELCLSIKGVLIMMRPHKTISPFRVELTYYKCPTCMSEWRLNMGQARHLVSKRLKQYNALAERLGMKK